jgi:eukaryotic-like serine/threonine-protein kinase
MALGSNSPARDVAPAFVERRGRRQSGAFESTADHELVQRRLALTYGLFALLMTGVLVLSTVVVSFQTAIPVFYLEPGKLAFIGAIAVLVAAWLACRGRLRPAPVLGCIDGLTLLALVSLLSLTATYAPAALRVEQLNATLFALAVMLRAALVPSPPAWTALVSSIAAVPLPISAYLVMRDGRGVQPPFPAELGIALACCWGSAATVAAWAISRVVYGLRVQVRSAMQFGQYTLEEKLGEGGMGVVYRARHALLRRPTAVKLISTSPADAVRMKRFEREVQLTSRLTHPNTVAVYDYGHTYDGVFYYAMELLDGLSLAELCDEDGPQPPGRVAHILAQAARALAEAHSIGLIHRDVKPANIFLTVRGGIHDFVKVLDFGLVKEMGAADPTITSPNTIAGTPLYMAPETIAKPETVDASVDVYALGAVGYYLLTGEPPFTGPNAIEVYHGHLHVVPPIPSKRLGRAVPGELESIVMDCLAKAPAERPPSANDLAERLEAVMADHPWTASDAKAWWAARRAPRNAEQQARDVESQNLSRPATQLAITVRERS